MSDLVCAGCGEDELLRGERSGDAITVECERCGLVWTRDLNPTCPTCGETDVRPALQAVVDKSRGTQLSIQSMLVVHLCPECDAERLAVWNNSNTPLAPAELPVARDDE